MSATMTTRELADALGLSMSRTRRVAAERGISPLVAGSPGRGAVWPPEAIDRMRVRRPRGNPAFVKGRK